MDVIAHKKVELSSKLEVTSIAISSENKRMALEVLENTPLPTTRTEAWKYTRVAKIGKIAFTNQQAKVANIEKFNIDSSAATLVFVNGHFSEELSSNELPNGISYSLLSELKELPATKLKLENEIFNSLNTAYLTDGVQITIAKNTAVEAPVQILHILKGTEVISNFKVIVNAEKSSQAHIIQGFFSEEGDKKFCNTTSEINVAENAVLSIDKIQYEDEQSFHISTEEVSQERNSLFTINTSTLNGGFVRNNLHINVNGENCNSVLNGIYLTKNKQHIDNHTIVDHIAAHCESHELYKGVMDDKSTAVFNGKVFVRPNAQKINAFQSNGNVLLSDDATVNSKPELEIYADDVKCSHGSTTGQLDDEAIFYLRARGISKRSAHQLMVSAFIGEVLDLIKNKNVRSYVDGLLEERFGWE
ncbi:MAG: Fe-S cluster assembly protein SufD [Fluviicola sp.]|nr:Fe-S cluster assembly protein SufD [Fluviicola sp.]